MVMSGKLLTQTMTKLRSLVERTGIALFLVSHLRRTQTDQKPMKMDTELVLDSYEEVRQLHNSLDDAVIALERDQQDRSEQSLTTVRVLKNRYSGETGVACKLRYDLSTCKFIELEVEEEFDPTTDFEHPWYTYLKKLLHLLIRRLFGKPPTLH